MSLPQPYNIPNTPKQSSEKSSLPEYSRSRPVFRDFLGGLAVDRGNLPVLQNGSLSKVIYRPTLSNSAANAWREINKSPTMGTDPTSSYYLIYKYQTRQATFAIQSIDPYLSDEKILEMLISIEDLYWGYFTSPDQKSQGYIGFYYPANTYPGSGPAHTHISISWPSHTKIHLVNRLRMLAREGCKQFAFWSALVGAVAAADQLKNIKSAPKGYTPVSNLPANFARLNYDACNAGCTSDREPSIEIIQRSARYLAAPFSTTSPDPVPEDIDECGRAIFWMELGKALWLPDSLYEAGWIFNNPVQSIDTFLFFARIADQWINLISDDQIAITVSGLKLKYEIDERASSTGFWQQAVEYERWKIPLQALKYIHDHRVCMSENRTYGTVGGFDKEYSDALATKLIVEAKQRGVYVPQGGFRTAVPPCIPITGVDQLCVWSDGNGLWVLPIPTGLSFYWRPEQTNPLSKYLGDEDFLSAWNLTLAALWHDLVTEGSKVVVRTGDEPVLPSSRAERVNRKRHSRSRSNSHVLRLPSQRVIHMGGVHSWGTPDEIEKIKRQAHQVRGHRRKLLPGHQRSLYALENARRFNFIMPDGYTFVKPYQTGLSDPDAPATKETPILARGLASLMLMSKDYSKRSAAS